MSLKALLEKKARRTAKLPVAVGDADAAAAEVSVIRAALDVHLRMVQEHKEGGAEPSAADDERGVKLREQLTAAKSRQAETVVEIDLHSLPADEWEELCAGLPEDPETGGFDVSEVRAEIVAACCVDPELQDVEWWRDQFKRPEWSKGELLAVNMALLNLNLATPSGYAGKG